MADNGFGIGEIAARSGLRRATPRYYEAQGLLPPHADCAATLARAIPGASQRGRRRR